MLYPKGHIHLFQPFVSSLNFVSLLYTLLYTSLFESFNHLAIFASYI